MADERIEDITGGELTTIAPDDKFVVLDKSDTTDDADGTVKYIEAATMGMLQTNVSSADADVTGAVGVLDCVDISGYTADRDYILPTTAAVGDRAGICITTGDDAFELDLHTVSASTDTINGVDSSVGTASWSRVFITGEVVIFRCVVANTAWVVEYDGRKPSSCYVTLSADVTTNSAGTVKEIGFDTETYDNGSIYDTTSKYAVVRRNGMYNASGVIMPSSATSDTKYYGYMLFDNVVASYTTSYFEDTRRQSIASSVLATASCSCVVELTAGGLLVPTFYADEANRGVKRTHGIPHPLSFFALNEVL